MDGETAVTADAYEICRRVQQYVQKNGYSPKRDELTARWCEPAFLELLVLNEVVELLPLYESGPLVCVVLTPKGARMAARER